MRLLFRVLYPVEDVTAVTGFTSVPHAVHQRSDIHSTSCARRTGQRLLSALKRNQRLFRVSNYYDFSWKTPTTPKSI